MGDRLPSVPWMPLVTGDRLSVLKPEPEKITVEAIAYGLAGQYRFGGQSRPRITVAEHSVLAAEYADRKGHGLRMTMLMLFHDGAEALGWGDLPRPNKQHCHSYQTLIGRCQRAVWDAVGIVPPGVGEMLRMKRINDTMLATEVAASAFDPVGWNLTEKPDPDTSIEWWNPNSAQHFFIAAWMSLRDRALATGAPRI